MSLRRAIRGARCFYHGLSRRGLATSTTNNQTNTINTTSVSNIINSSIDTSSSSSSNLDPSSKLPSHPLSSLSIRREVVLPYQIYRRALCLTKERPEIIFSPPDVLDDDDDNHALSPTDPRFIHLFPSLAIRSYQPSPFSVPFYQNNIPPVPPIERYHYEHSLSNWNQLHCHLFHVTGSDRWAYAAVNKSIMFSRELLYDDQFLIDWTNRRKQALKLRRDHSLTILQNVYADEFGEVARKQVHRAIMEQNLLEKLRSLLDEEHSLQNRELVVRESSSGISANEQLQILDSIHEQLSQVRHAIDEMLISLHFDPEAPKGTLLYADPAVLEAKANSIANIVQGFDSWCAVTIKKAFDEQSSWIPETHREMETHRAMKRENYRLFTPIVTRFYRRKFPSPPKPVKLRSRGRGSPLWLLYLEEAKAELEARRQNSDLQNTPPSFAVILSQYFDVSSVRFMMEFWRHRQSVREMHRRMQEEHITMSASLFRMKSSQRYWHFRRQELRFWCQVVNAEIKHNAQNSASVSETIESWQSSLMGHRPNIPEILQLLKDCLPYLSIREPIPRLSSSLEEFCPPEPDPMEDIYGSSSFEQSPFSLPYSEQHSDELNEASIRFFHDPQSGHKFSIGLVNSRADLVTQIARAILAAFTEDSSAALSETKISSANWLELRPDESSDGIEAESTTLKSSHDSSGTSSAEALALLNKHSISPLLLPDFVQEGWVMIDMGELMILSCSDISMMSTWISNDKQVMNKVNEDQFLHLCETTPPALNQCNVLVKSIRSTQLALSTEQISQST